MKIKFVSLLADPLNEAYRELCFSLSQVGLNIEYLDKLDWQSALQLLKDGEVQAGAVCGLLYATLRGQGTDLSPVAAPLLEHPRYESSPHYWAEVVVTSDSPLNRIEDLEGKTWLYNEPGSYSGYHAYLASLRRAGLKQDFLGPRIPTGSHQSSLQRLLDREGDYTVLDSTFLDFQSLQIRSKVKVIKSLGPAPMPLMVSYSRYREVIWTACQALETYRAPLTQLQAVPDQAYDQLRNDWNESLYFREDTKSQLFVMDPLAQKTPAFTSREQLQHDQKILGAISQELLSQMEKKPESTLSNGVQFHRIRHDNREHHHYLIAPESLQTGDLSVVGFLSRMKPGVDVQALFDVDDQLLHQLRNYEGFLSYSPTEYSTGLWANLAVFRSSRARDHWAANSTHLRAIKDLGPSSYDHVRLHLGVWPSLDQPLRWVATRYLSYTDSGLWRAVQTQGAA